VTTVEVIILCSISPQQVYDEFLKHIVCYKSKLGDIIIIC